MANHKSILQLVADWRASRTQVEKAIGQLPIIVGVECVKVVKENFRLQGYDNGMNLTKWPKRKASTDLRYTRRYGVKGSVFNAANKIMEQTGNLRDGVKYKITGRLIFIGVDNQLLPYSQIHNEGLHGSAWGRHPFVMPLRKYMPTANEGANPKMITAIQKKLTADIGVAMKIFKK